MITKIAAQSLIFQQLGRCCFSKLVSKGESLVTEMPVVNIPNREKYDEEERFYKDKLYDMNAYQRKTKPPRCRYYALEYKNRIYHVYNAYYYPMGRMVGQIATAIRGKNSPLYRNNEANIKNGDICVIVNAVDPLFTGKKLLYKNLKYHTGFIGHLRTHSYKSVLNSKPELLYFYLLRKFMPKNKISQKYLQNVKIYRGPTHDIPHLPQFAPDKNIYEYLPESNLDEFIKMSPDIKLVKQSYPGLAKQTHGRDFEFYKDEQADEQSSIDHEDTSKLYEQPKQMIQKVAHTEKDIQKMKRREKRYLDRHTPIRAPRKAKNQVDPGFLYIKDERKAKKMDEYAEIADEDMQQQEEQIIDDPFGRKLKDETIKKIRQAEKKNKKQ